MVGAMLLGPAAGAGMLQLEPATWGQAGKGVDCLGTSSRRLVGHVLLDQFPGCAIGGQTPVAMET